MIHGTTRLRDRQLPGKGLNTGEGRQHATGDPRALLPGYIPSGKRSLKMPDLSAAVTEERQGVVIAIEVTAGAKEDVFPAGYNEWRRTIGCRVSAPALEGRANRAILKLVSGTLGVPTTSVSILSGAASSQKRVLVTGMGRDQVLGNIARDR
jgi:uncharacterized protein (TIGR00251 family)